MKIGRKAMAYSSPCFVVAVRLASVVAMATCGSTVLAEDVYITADGHRHSMTRSTTEYAVFLDNPDKADASAKRLQKSSLGRLDRFEHFPYGSMYRLTTDQVSQKRSASILSDPDIISVRSVYRFGKEAAPVVSTGQIVLRLKPDVTDDQRDELFNKHALGIVKDVARMKGVYLVQPLVIDSDLTIAERLSYDERVVWATPNLIRSTVTNQANFADEFFARQWHHQNFGDNGGVVDADIDTPEAWEITTGAGVRMGLFDSGVDVDHEDLVDRYIGIGRDLTLQAFEEDGQNPRPKRALEAHGTAVAGLMLASANGVGVRGVAPSAEFTASRSVGLGGVDEFGWANGYLFAAFTRRVDVHNNSWSFEPGSPNSPIIVDGIRTAFEEGRNGLGMVILFSAGNENALLGSGFGLSTLPEVIGVGATDRSDRRSSFSNFGPDIDILAPGGSGNGDITTTDNTDPCCWFDENGELTNDPEERISAAWGYNRAGTSRDPEFGLDFGTDIDTTGSYTGGFNGTSAACPIASGVAALVLSVNPNLTATQVRVLLQHTTDLVSADVARYDPITGQSTEYAFGRVNALSAVLAAQASLTNGGFTWPDRAADAGVEASRMVWTVGAEADEFFIVQSQNEFEFLPADGACYDSDQAGCDGSLADLPDNLSVIFVGCDGTCTEGSAQETSVVRPEVGSRTAAIYARNTTTGRYSFGARVRLEAARAPSVVINVSPLSGESPLEVTFQGNAVSELEIDDSRTSWDFDTNDGISTDATDRTTTHTYTVAAGIERVFTARLTMFDVDGNDGISEVSIRVQGPSVQSTGVEAGPGDLTVVIGRPGSPGSNIDGGKSPLDVEIGLQATSISGILQSVSWDLGDGQTASGLVIPHTYTNGGAESVRIPITATVRTTTAEGQTVSTVAFKVLDVEPGDDGVDTGTPTLPGTTPIGGTGSALAPCGATGMIPLLFMAFSLSLLRWGRRRK
jgi:subtilisin family serine protease